MILNAPFYQKNKKNLNALNNLRQEATYNLIYTTHIFFLTHTHTHTYIYIYIIKFSNELKEITTKKIFIYMIINNIFS